MFALAERESYLEGSEPGPELATVLAEIDLESLSGAELVAILRAQDRMVSHYQAMRARTMVAILDAYRTEVGLDDEEYTWRSTAAEVGAALHLTRRTSDRELDEARQLVERLPEVGEALASGLIDRRRAAVLIGETRHLPKAAARSLVASLLDEAGELTAGQLAARIRRLIIETDPDAAHRRVSEAVNERRVVCEPTDDGAANLLILDAEPHLVHAARERIGRLARNLKTGDDPRSIDQIRADVALHLLCNGETDLTRQAGVGSGGRVELVVDLTTLAGLDDSPAELSGFGPVVAEIARRVASQIRRWDFSVTDAHHGHLVATGVVRRRPTSAHARRVRTRDRTCVFPGCRMPAVDCDLDHRRPYAHGGPTCPCNLDPLCRFHHTLRHKAGWTHRREPDGTQVWTSPLGRTYVRRPRAP
jgi:hypothetical protein